MTQKRIKVIGFDADDTLWVNEPYYRTVEEEFKRLMMPYDTGVDITQELYRTEMNNLSIYGYGIKSFMLSLVQCAIEVTEGKVSTETIAQILDLGKGMLRRPIELLEDVKTVLETLAEDYTLIVATKGDLLDQEKKMMKSSIASYFHHIEIMSDKMEQNYVQLLKHLDMPPGEFVMIGNSMKSDILPVLNLGSYAIHVPFHTTWIHEEIDEEPVSDRFFKAEKLKDTLEIIRKLEEE